MKNIQVIDSAGNAVYDIFAAPDAIFDLVFLPGTDIAFIEEIAQRPNAEEVYAALGRIWSNRLAKRYVMGIHGVLFYQLLNKRRYYPTLRDEEAKDLDGPPRVRRARAQSASMEGMPTAPGKNIQVIDDGANATYDIFNVTNEVFAQVFLPGTDIAFIEDITQRDFADEVLAAIETMWQHRVPKADARGIHGVLFYQLARKRQYYPTLRDEDAINPDGSLLRSSGR